MSTQTTLNYRTNRDLFSNYHLDEHLPETEAWDQVDDDELRAAYDEIKQLWEREKDTAPKRNESQLEEKFIRPMFRKLGIPFEVEESTEGTQRRPDYGFFRTEEDGVDAFQRREEGGDFYKNAVAVADAKRWGRKLDTRGKKKRDYENPSHQIDQYLRFTSTTWGVLTNGQKWRLYYKPTSHRLDSYYEIDLPTVLEQGDLEDFKYFYLFFRHDAFVPDTSGDAFLDDVYEESNVFAQELGEDLQDNIYEAIKLLAEGYLQYPENDLDEEDLELIHDSSLIYLYRIIFVLYAEAEGRDLLDTNNEIYESQYSLNQLKQEVADELESGDPKYRDWQSNLQSRLDELFSLIDQGSKSRGIPEEDLYIPAYNGGLFRTNPDKSGNKEARFLANNTVGDEHLARVIELLTRSENSNGGGKIFVDYSSLDVRHLGSIYEGLLEYQLNVADEPLALDDGEYAVADESSEVVVERDKVYLTTDSGERKATGSYYTPEYIVEYIVEETLRGPVDEIRKDVVMDERFQNGGYAEEFAERVFDLKILDPAMGSGHFLTSVVDYLARAIITEQNREADEKDGDVIDDEHDINWARRKVAQQCIYGVDINPLATELAKVSLWLRTLAAEQPLAFLDHHLKTGNSLVGSDIQDVLVDDDESKTDEGQLTLEQSFAHTRKQALDHVMDRFSELLAIDNETLEDAKEMEDVYQSVQSDPLYQKLLSMANVHTADQFGLDIPSDADKRMAEALRGDSWEDIEEQDWFSSAQRMADDKIFFHWELEFPVAFYDIDGNRIENPGFDAVIGNPPWGAHLEDNEKEYLLNEHSSIDSKPKDTYLFFISESIKLLREEGRLGYVTPNTWLLINSAEKFRKSILSYNIDKIVDYGDGVFDGVTVESCVIILENKKGGDKECTAIRVQDNEKVAENSVDKSVWKSDKHYKILIDFDPEKYELVNKLKTDNDSFSDYCTITWGIKPYQKGHGEPPQTREIIDDRSYHSETKKGSDWKPLLTGSDVDRYLIDFPGNQYIKYGKNLMYQSNEDLITKDKILLQQTSDTLKACFDNGKYYPQNSLFIIDSEKVDNRYLLSLMNSKLFRFFYQHLNPQKGKVLAEIKPSVIKQLPVKIPSKLNKDRDDYDILDKLKDHYANELSYDSIDAVKNILQEHTSQDIVKSYFLEYLASQMSDYKKRQNNLNLNLLDYFGNYDEGAKLPDIGLYQPTESNILDATADEYEKLQIEQIHIERSNSRIMISATARYKPEDEDAFETDTYGYTETEYKEAFSLNNLSDKEAALIEAFVPVAVNKAGGFANFRDNATKTNSLIDRLKAMTLPDIDDVEDDLERYIEIKERADELDKKIKKTDQLIDEIVYDLYDLTDEEIEIVESAVADD